MSLFATKRKPVHEIDLLYGKQDCTRSDTCRKFSEQFMSRMVGRYVGLGRTFVRQIKSAAIDLREFDYDTYLAEVKKIHRGEALRKSRKAERMGYFCRQFVWQNHIPDIYEIDTSKEVRSGGPMRAAYRRTVDERGGLPVEKQELTNAPCNLHGIYSWGIFEPCDGYQQGEITTNAKLLGYVKFKRQGSLGIYTSILGHGDYLRHGIMYMLHYSIMNWIGQNVDGPLRGMDFLMYGAADSGGESLWAWKKRQLFQGAYFVLNEAPQLD